MRGVRRTIMNYTPENGNTLLFLKASKRKNSKNVNFSFYINLKSVFSEDLIITDGFADFFRCYYQHYTPDLLNTETAVRFFNDTVSRYLFGWNTDENYYQCQTVKSTVSFKLTVKGHLVNCNIIDAALNSFKDNFLNIVRNIKNSTKDFNVIFEKCLS